MRLVDETRPVRIVFDSLSEMRLLAGESLRYRRQILALKQQFAGRNTTVLFLDDKTGNTGDSQLESLAHGVILLERVAPEFGAVRRRLEVVKLRGVDFLSGKHDFAIDRGGLRVFPRLAAAPGRTHYPREVLHSGVPALDAMLGGGIHRGTSTVLLGPAGTGKSSIAFQYARSAIKRGERVAWFAFDESLEVFAERNRNLGLELTPAQRDLLSIRQVDPAELSPGEFAAICRDQVERLDARVVVIDSLNGYLMAMPEERFLLLHMHELLTYLGQRGVSTFLPVTQHGLVGRMHAPVDMTYLSDCVLLLRFFEAGGRVRKAISVMKRRVGAHEDTIREFRTMATGIQVGEPLVGFRGVLTGTPEIDSAGLSHGGMK